MTVFIEIFTMVHNEQSTIPSISFDIFIFFRLLKHNSILKKQTALHALCLIFEFHSKSMAILPCFPPSIRGPLAVSYEQLVLK